MNDPVTGMEYLAERQTHDPDGDMVLGPGDRDEAIADYVAACRERDEARRTAEWWRDCSRDFDEPGSMHPDVYRLPWESDVGETSTS